MGTKRSKMKVTDEGVVEEFCQRNENEVNLNIEFIVQSNTEVIYEEQQFSKPLVTARFVSDENIKQICDLNIKLKAQSNIEVHCEEQHISKPLGTAHFVSDENIEQIQDLTSNSDFGPMERTKNIISAVKKTKNLVEVEVEVEVEVGV